MFFFNRNELGKKGYWTNFHSSNRFKDMNQLNLECGPYEAYGENLMCSYQLCHVMNTSLQYLSIFWEYLDFTFTL